MKTASRVICVMALLAGLNVFAEREKPFIQTKTKKITADKITSDSKGVLTYSASGFSQKMKPNGYIYARIPKPTEIFKAFSKLKSKKYADAAKYFESAYKKYRYLGWNVYCIYYEAYALEKLGKKAEAIVKIKKLDETPKDKTKMRRYMEAKKLLADLYIAENKFEPAQEVLKELGGAQDPAIAAFANNKQGDILAKKGKNKDALLMYLRTVLLFDKHNKKERPEALAKTVKLLKDSKNNKYLVFEKMLKADYP